ncbi:hypothetical protein B296_00040446 [Ensete ventricosum]|uniref:Transposase (putative) gypsy type domain-containing protein n=1 Tax=Ensete ventricosum TaxID=4639 RepID=A0A426XH41_ENSVE|nr:hypothetical protein B296_00040446 [Ensete ventricosum]
MTSSDSSSSVRVVSSLGSGEASRCDPEVGSSRESSGPPSPVDVRVLRDLEVMKADHDLDTVVTERSLDVIRERYDIPTEYGLHVPQPGQCPHSSNAPGMCISVDALEIDLRFPLHSLIEECLRWWRISPSQVAPNSSRCLVVYLGECRGAGIIPTRDLFMTCFLLYKSRGGYYLIARVSFRIRWISVSCLGCSRCPTQGPSNLPRRREVDASPVREAPKASSKRPVDAPTEQTDDPTRRHKKVKVLTRRHKSHHDEGGSRSRFKGKEPAAPSEEPDTPVESEEGGASSVHHRPRSMKDLFKTKVHKDDTGHYTLQMSDLGHQNPDKEMKARWRGLKNSTKVWNDSSATEEFERGLLHPQLARELYTLPTEVLLAQATKEMVLMTLFDRGHDVGRLITFMDYRISQLQQELDALKSSGGPEAVAKAEECASKLQKELEKTTRERDEALLRCEALEKELNEVQSNLAEVQRLLKEVQVRARKMDDEPS